MTFDMTKVLGGLKTALAAAQDLAGPLAAIGVPYAGLAKSALTIAQNIDQRITDGTIVATSEDHAAVKQIITDLEAENDRLAAEIDAS
jgi:hypothetical protein